SSLLAAAGPDASQTMTYAAGEPSNVAASTQMATELLPYLSEGAITFDGHGWTVTGAANSPADRAAIDAAFAANQLAAAGWSMAVTEPAPVVEAPPVIDPAYTFSARRDADGAVQLSGQVPAEPAARYFGAISSGDIAEVTVAPGAPENFLPSAETGLRALLLLQTGELEFSAGNWSLEGTAPDAETNTAIAAALAADPGAAAWDSAIDI